jgi:glucose-1-phosphate thymidylyltransferase
MEERSGLKIACLEEVALVMGFIGPEQVLATGKPIAHTDYGRYLLRLVESQQHTT